MVKRMLQTEYTYVAHLCTYVKETSLGAFKVHFMVLKHVLKRECSLRGSSLDCYKVYLSPPSLGFMK